MKRPQPPLYLYAAAAVMLALHFLAPVARVIPPRWNLAGLAPLLAGLWANLWASRAFRRAGTAIKVHQESAQLLTHGLNRVTRNPMYLGMALMLAGTALLLGSVSPWLVLPPFIALMNRQFIAIEERMLEARFGEAFLAYRQRVRRWV